MLYGWLYKVPHIYIYWSLQIQSLRFRSLDEESNYLVKKKLLEEEKTVTICEFLEESQQL